MAQDQEKGWKRFQRLRFDRKQALKRLRRVETVSVRHAHKFILKRWRNVRDVRGIVVVWLMAVGCLIGAAGLQFLWDRQSYEVAASALGGTYAEAIFGPVDTLNPLFADTPAEDAVSQLVFSRLLTYDKTGHLNYDAVKKLQSSKDGLVYTVTLRSDIFWHDGQRLDADDVMFTVGLLKDPITRTQIRGWDNIQAVKKGTYTIEFTLQSVYTPFESALTFPILPAHIFEGVEHDAVREHDFSGNPVGSGPFAFRLLQDTEQAEKKIIHLVANKQYYKSSPKLARFQILVATNDNVVQAALATNEVNGASGLSREFTYRLPEKRYTVQTQPIQAGVYALLNNDSDILSDKAVRRALQYATNTQEVREKVGGDVPEMGLPYTSFHIDATDEAGKPKPPRYNPGQAKKLLDRAGWKLDSDGVRTKNGKPLRLAVVTTKNADYERALETIAGQWRSIGVEVDTRIIDAADPTQSFVQSVLQPRAYDVLLYQLTIGGDPDVFAYWHSSQAVARGLNLANYSSPVADDILSSARAAVSDELRTAKHAAFARQWIEDAPAIGLYQAITRTAVGKSVGGMQQDASLVMPYARYGEAYLWTVGNRTVYKTP